MIKRINMLAGLGMMMCSASASALVISDLDLSSQSFEVDNLDSTEFVSGTSNGIGFQLTTSWYYKPFSNTTGSQYYNDMPGGYDDLHLSRDFTITFDTAIDYLLVALANDNDTGDGPNLGVVPVDYMDVTVTGTQISINDINGALVLYEFGSPITSIMHIDNNGINDGFDVSFFAGQYKDGGAGVPEPPVAWLIGAGLLAGGVARRREKVRS